MKTIVVISNFSNFWTALGADIVLKFWRANDENCHFGIYEHTGIFFLTMVDVRKRT